MKKWAFHSQMFFLAHKFKIHQDLSDHQGTVVQDRTIYEDAEIFAENLYRSKKMSKSEYQTYRKLYTSITRTLRPPDLMIYLRASVRTVRKANSVPRRPEEQDIPCVTFDGCTTFMKSGSHATKNHPRSSSKLIHWTTFKTSSIASRSLKPSKRIFRDAKLSLVARCFKSEWFLSPSQGFDE